MFLSLFIPADLILRSLHLDDMCTEENLTSSLQPGLVSSQPPQSRAPEQRVAAAATTSLNPRSKWSNLENPSPAQLATQHQQLLAKQMDNRRTPARKRGLSTPGGATSPGVARSSASRPSQSQSTAVNVPAAVRSHANSTSHPVHVPVTRTGNCNDDGDDEDVLLQEAAEMCSVLENTFADDNGDDDDLPLASSPVTNCQQARVCVREQRQPLQQPCFPSPSSGHISATPAFEYPDDLDDIECEEVLLRGCPSSIPVCRSPPGCDDSDGAVPQSSCASTTSPHIGDHRRDQVCLPASSSKALSQDVLTSHRSSETSSALNAVACQVSDRQPRCEAGRQSSISTNGVSSTSAPRKFTFVHKPSSLSSATSPPSMPPPSSPPSASSGISSAVSDPARLMNPSRQQPTYTTSGCAKQSSMSVTRPALQNLAKSRKSSDNINHVQPSPLGECLRQPFTDRVPVSRQSQQVQSSSKTPVASRDTIVSNRPGAVQDAVSASKVSAASRLSKFQFSCRSPPPVTQPPQSIPHEQPDQVCNEVENVLSSANPPSVSSQQVSRKPGGQQSQTMRAALQVLRAGNSNTSASVSNLASKGHSVSAVQSNQVIPGALSGTEQLSQLKSQVSKNTTSFFSAKERQQAADMSLHVPTAKRKPVESSLLSTKGGSADVSHGTQTATCKGVGLFSSSAQSLGLIDDDDDLDDMEWLLTPNG